MEHMDTRVLSHVWGLLLLRAQDFSWSWNDQWLLLRAVGFQQLGAGMIMAPAVYYYRG